MDIGYISVIIYLICETEYLSLFVDEMNIPPQKGRNRSSRAFVDKEAVLAPHAPFSQGEPQVQPEFQVPPMP